jgi:SAM-dependent methyltransferase
MIGSSLADIAGTVVRKAVKTIRLRGLWGTVQHGGERLLRRVRRTTFTDNDPEGLEFDRTYGVDTRQTTDLGWLGRLTSLNWMHGQAYHPAPVAAVNQAFERLAPELHGATFIDIGSGKGRIVLLASLLPFGRVIGIEYDRVLHEVARRNVVSFESASKERIELLCLDATEFDFPVEPLVVFFHHPFDRPIFEIIVRRLEDAWRRSGQRISVIYFDPQCGDVFRSSPVFELHYESPPSSVNRVSHAIYRTR